ncbi:hypothetical protein [Alkalicoccus luteus]|uniref:Uncharacterized protein n=1 Tax=Alkalicoccus luteus TaxID=1237094 RepID=A0A969PRC9_9BACI|nr:hypothetical protein [Alkalicoccus luteus]NJP38982.1 hypothetical protein [Alkalicoccus luteus]
MAIFDEKNKKGRLKRIQPKGKSIFVEADAVRKKEEKKKKVAVKSSFADISPVIDITGNGYFQLSNEDGYMEIVQVSSADIYSLNNEDKEKKINLFAFFLQWYQHDLKVVPLNFPVDTYTQQQFIQKKIEQTSNPQSQFFLEQKLRELQFIETERSNREFYLFIYADDEYTLRSRINDVTAQMNVVSPIIRLSDEKKINILYKLNNLNSKNKSTKGDY